MKPRFVIYFTRPEMPIYFCPINAQAVKLKYSEAGQRFWMRESCGYVPDHGGGRSSCPAPFGDCTCLKG